MYVHICKKDRCLIDEGGIGEVEIVDGGFEGIIPKTKKHLDSQCHMQLQCRTKREGEKRSQIFTKERTRKGQT
jgi:hypothetical protein